MSVTIERAIEIMEPGGGPKSPVEYEAARKMAAAALRIAAADETKRGAILEAANDGT